MKNRNTLIVAGVIAGLLFLYWLFTRNSKNGSTLSTNGTGTLTPRTTTVGRVNKNLGDFNANAPVNNNLNTGRFSGAALPSLPNPNGLTREEFINQSLAIIQSSYSSTTGRGASLDANKRGIALRALNNIYDNPNIGRSNCVCDEQGRTDSCISCNFNCCGEWFPKL